MMSMLDDFSGYNQVMVKKEDRHKTTFITPWGTFEYLRMPFGLLNARVQPFKGPWTMLLRN